MSHFMKQTPTTVHVPPLNTTTSLLHERMNSTKPLRNVSSSPANRLIASYCSVRTPWSRRRLERRRIGLRGVISGIGQRPLWATGRSSSGSSRMTSRRGVPECPPPPFSSEPEQPKNLDCQPPRQKYRDIRNAGERLQRRLRIHRTEEKVPSEGSEDPGRPWQEKAPPGIADDEPTAYEGDNREGSLSRIIGDSDQDRSIYQIHPTFRKSSQK